MNKMIIADLTLILITFIWGTTFVMVQNAVHFLPPLAFNTFRFSMASLFLLGFLLFFRPTSIRRINKQILRDGSIIGAWLFAGYAFQTAGLQYTTTAKSGFITGLSVVTVPLFAYLILKQKPNPKALVGTLSATIGLYFLTGGYSLAINFGDFLTLLCAVAFALQITYTGRYAPHYPVLLLAWVQITMVALFSLLTTLLIEKSSLQFVQQSLRNPEVLWALGVTSLLATAVAFLAQTMCQKFTKATHVALIFTMEPVFAGLTAYFYSHEKFTSNSLIGSLFIFFGMVFAELPSIKKKKSGNIPLRSTN